MAGLMQSMFSHVDSIGLDQAVVSNFKSVSTAMQQQALVDSAHPHVVPKQQMHVQQAGEAASSLVSHVPSVYHAKAAEVPTTMRAPLLSMQPPPQPQ